jgi:hypothetical protein
MRLAVREYEYLRIDSTAPASNGQTGRDLRGIPRITYAATIPLG